MTVPAPARPVVRPARPEFSCGPCAKHPGWTVEHLGHAPLGRSHRSTPGKARLQRAIALTRQLLDVPDSHLIAIVPGSDTGAVEMAMWSMLGSRPVQVMAFENFSRDWAIDTMEQLRLDDAEVLDAPYAEVLDAPYGELPDLKRVRPDADLVFAWNGTTSGVRVPDAGFISPAREGLTICDATSAAFAQPLDWGKLDVVTFSWQKVLGGEAAHGVLILGPRAVERLESYTPPRALPKLFRMTKPGPDGRPVLDRALFQGATLNTPSMLCVEEAIDAMEWGLGIGGLKAMHARADANAAVLNRWIEATPWVDWLARDPATRSNTSVCLKIVDPRVAALPEEAQKAFAGKIADLLEAEGAALDIGGYRDAPPSLRVWCGATVETTDLQALTPWLDWAFETLAAEVA